MMQDACSYEYNLDDTFFQSIDAPDIRKGKLHTNVNIRKLAGNFILDFHIVGTAVVPCDRCLDDVGIAVDTINTLKVKFGTCFSDEEEWVIVPEEEGYIDLSWFLYEFIELSLPMQRVHESGECNQEMMTVLHQHLCVEEDESLASDSGQVSEYDTIDPRWNGLKKILDNN